MSYILKALARSERERKRQRSPDLRDGVEPIDEGPSKARSSIVLIVFLLANTLLLGGILLIRTQGTDPGPLSAQDDETSTPAVAVTRSILDARPESSTETQPPAPDPTEPSPAPPSTPETRIATRPATRPLLLEAKPPTPSHPVPSTQARAQPAPAPVAVSKPSVPQSEETLDGVDRVDSLPDIEITVHVYADDPQRRFAYVNGVRYVEGDTLRTGGARLERITPDGILFDLGTRRVLLSARP